MPRLVQQQFPVNMIQEKSNEEMLLQLQQLKMAMNSNSFSFMAQQPNQDNANIFQQHMSPLNHDCFSIDNQKAEIPTNIQFQVQGPNSSDNRTCRTMCLEALDETMDVDFDFEPRPIASFR